MSKKHLAAQPDFTFDSPEPFALVPQVATDGDTRDESRNQVEIMSLNPAWEPLWGC